MSDVMLFGVLRMPYAMAMADDIARSQYWQRGQQAADEITRLRNELHIAQEWSARVIAGHEQDMTEITALRAENERLSKDYQTARDAHDKLLAENERFKISLSDTVQQTQDQASEITALRAENEKLRAALEGYACTCTGGECAEQAGYRDECGKPARAALEEKQ